jgi:hypothetical protein
MGRVQNVGSVRKKWQGKRAGPGDRACFAILKYVYICIPKSIYLLETKISLWPPRRFALVIRPIYFYKINKYINAHFVNLVEIDNKINIHILKIIKL